MSRRIALIASIFSIACNESPSESPDGGTLPDGAPIPVRDGGPPDPERDAGMRTDAGPIVFPGADGGPILLFSDLLSGPNDGNGDTSAGEGGAIVTVWGRNLGSERGDSSIEVGGVEAPIYTWRNADGPAADMYSRHGMQRVSFLVPSSAPLGNTSIRATVGGEETNELPFTIRSEGAIHFVSPSGDDGDDGSFGSPWESLAHAVDEMRSGDIVYAMDGVVQNETHQFHGCVNFADDGTAELPRALVAYPDARVVVGGPGHDCDEPFDDFNGGGNRNSRHWVVSQMRAMGGGSNALPANTGYRLVGNYVEMDDPIDNCQSGAVSVEGNDVFVLGNQIARTAVNNPNVSKLCHTIYISGPRCFRELDNTCGGVRWPTESNREIGWNLLNDNQDNRGINLYSEGSLSAFIEGHRVHDNFIINHRGDGILIGYYVTGENWFYNNVVINTGLGPEWNGEVSGHYAIQVGAGHDERSTTLHIVNNTIYGGGYPENADSTMIAWYPAGEVELDFANNIVVSPDVPYTSGDMPEVDSPNLFFGQSDEPSWNRGAIEGDPLFVDPDAANLRLSEGSPAIDRTESEILADFDGIRRPQGGSSDLGAYEYAD
jgi:hypothetical protein